jgi:hypothetical protein
MYKNNLNQHTLDLSSFELKERRKEHTQPWLGGQTQSPSHGSDHANGFGVTYGWV